MPIWIGLWKSRLLTTQVAEDSDEQTAYLLRMQGVGKRVAEMQVALASRDDVTEFAPEPISPEDIRGLARRTVAEGRVDV